MLKNKAQIARESIKTTPELQGPLSGAHMDPSAESEFASRARVNVRAGGAHLQLRSPSPPPPP